MNAIDSFLKLFTHRVDNSHPYWAQLAEWLKHAVEKFKEKFDEPIEGFRTFIQKTADGLKNIIKLYNVDQETKEWKETVFIKPVSEADVPKEIMKKLKKAPLDAEVSTVKELFRYLELTNDSIPI